MIRALALLAALAATGAQAQCRQALALGLDVSGSVDAREYRLQLEGLAAALDDPQVRGKLLAMPGAPVRFMVYEWSGPADQSVLVPWTQLDSQAVIDGVSETLRQTVRRDASPGTALGTAMQVGRIHLDAQRACWKRVLDISGDGTSNLGPRPRRMKDLIAPSGITINALVIGVDDPVADDARQSDIATLEAYFRAEVIHGPDAFVITARGFKDYARAMRAKLLREVDALVTSQLQ